MLVDYSSGKFQKSYYFMLLVAFLRQESLYDIPSICIWCHILSYISLFTQDDCILFIFYELLKLDSISENVE